ncbi:MAG: hypothetical protein ACE1Y4_14855 [Lysobacterales bacterium]
MTFPQLCLGDDAVLDFIGAGVDQELRSFFSDPAVDHIGANVVGLKPPRTPAHPGTISRQVEWGNVTVGPLADRPLRLQLHGPVE